MAYDTKLADRIRELIATERGVTEQKMFGGLAFLIGGNMAIAASGQGGLLVHVDPEESDTIVKKTAAEPMVMRGRAMRGWVRVDVNDVKTKRQLQKWVDIGVDQLTFSPTTNILPTEVVVQSMELFGQEVIPQFDKDPIHSTTRYRQQAAARLA